jgi:hypothetical protein
LLTQKISRLHFVPLEMTEEPLMGGTFGMTIKTSSVTALAAVTPSPSGEGYNMVYSRHS